LDVVLNLDDSQRAGQDTMEDNWLLQFLQRRGKRIIFFGDETWLRLYTYLIKRADGTSSLFAWDTVEVDQNVTRHVEPELNNEDWDVMILHYLGVDHVGHTYGPKR
jgi:ethanolaminephosphotransferase